MATESESAPQRHKALPIGLVTTCRTLLIIGGGIDTVPRTRHATMFDWHAIKVLLPQPNAEVLAIASTDSRITIELRKPTEDDVATAHVVVKDSGDHGNGQEITDWCRKHRKLLNCVDQPEFCDLYYMSLIFRDPLIVGVTSGGDAPAIASALRRHLEETLGRGWAVAAERMADLRKRLPGGHARVELLRNLGKNSELLSAIVRDDETGVQKIFDDEIARLRT